MNNIFTINPVKVNLISIKNTIKQTLVFIGIVPQNVKQELIKLEKSQNKIAGSNKILETFYGKSWQLKLGLYKPAKHGGDEFSFDTSEQSNISDEELASEIITEISDEIVEKPKDLHSKDVLEKLVDDASPPQDMQQSVDDKYVDNVISIDDLMDDESSSTPVDDDIKISQITAVEGSDAVRFIFSDPFLSIYPEDKTLEFKKKMYVVLGIPIFRQHIWYVYQGRTFPLNYSVFDHNSLLYVNVQRMLNYYNDTKNVPNLIETIPICTKYYQMKNSLKIITNDTFSILSEYYHKYGITEYNLLDLDDFIKPSRSALQKISSERYQLELIYYSFIVIYWPMLSLDAFSEYLKSENNIIKFYPEIYESRDELNLKYKLEKHIIDTKYDLITNHNKKEILKKIKGNITNSITSSIISVLKYQNSKDSILFIRNLFDIFPLSDDVPMCKCYMIHTGKKVSLNKSFKNNNFIKDELEPNSILFKVRVSPDSVKMINLTFYTNGNYIIKATWKEEDRYDFNNIFNIVKKLTDPIIECINAFDSYVLTNKKTIPLISKHNSKFTEIGVSMFYTKSFTYEQFNVLKNIMTDFTKAGIVRSRIVEKSMAEYYFSKGMYQFDASRIERVVNINNYYDFLTDGVIKQKWYTIFEKTRITKLYHRFSDIKIEILGVKENEFFIFYNYIITLFDIYYNQEKKIKKPSNKTQSQENQLKKSLRNLKEQDPVLYKFRKHYKTENIYSKICQKPYQPILLNKQGYDQLPADKKANALKYWNFTTNKDAYYMCPNPKFPHVKFIVKRHPKDYCFPCCKQLKISDDITEAKRIIHDICLKEHKYTKEERTITMGSRYIMSYGKDIEPGRLSRLPENSLEPVFYETFSLNEQGMDPECVSSDGYYMYGVEQHINGVLNVGILNIIINALETSLSDFIFNVIKLIKAMPTKFRILLNGDINKYFTTVENFIDTLTNLFLAPPSDIENTQQIFTSIDIPWNNIFIDILYLFININVIHFNHHQKLDKIKLMLPSYITSKDQFLSSEFKNIIVFKKKKKYYPIYFLNTNVFFKSKIFTKKIFTNTDSITIIISRLVESFFADRIKNNIMDNINLPILNKFVKQSNYKIKKLFVNSSNMCYYVHLVGNDNQNIFIPIELSYHLESKNIEITYEMYQRKKNIISIETMLKFMKDFNKWIAIESEKAGMVVVNVDKKLSIEENVQPIYPYIKIQKWLVMTEVNKIITNNSAVIGFMSYNSNYYIKDIKLSQAMRIKDVKIISIYYDPDVINQQIFSKSRVIFDKRCQKVGKSIYYSHLYQLILLEFMNIFNKQRNIALRQKIKKKLLGNLNKDFDDLMNDISDLVVDCDDYSKIKTQICEFINNHHSKNLLLNEIDDSFYKFDREIFEKIKKLPKDRLYQELYKISQKFITFGDVDKLKDFDFPNMYISCQTKNKNKKEQYCKDYKFIIDKKKFKNILEIMSADILNPVKEKWLFSSIFSDNVITFFKFIRRPNEQITITIEE